MAAAPAKCVEVTVVGGQQHTVRVAAGTPVAEVTVPGLVLPITSAVEVACPPLPDLLPGEDGLDGHLGPAPGPGDERPEPSPTAVASPTEPPDHGAPRRPARPADGPRRPRPDRGAPFHAAGQQTTVDVPPLRPRPSPADPTYTQADVGPARIGVPQFFIDRFRVPPFLLPIYQAAGTQYGVRWELLAAINEIETDYGRNLGVSTAGALGWMQFLPSTWAHYGVDGNGDGRKDPYNPVDAVFAAARYLRAAGVATDVRRAVFAYNHADWYVDAVLLRARLIAGLPVELIDSLTGLTQGRFPLDGRTTYADDPGTGSTDLHAGTGTGVLAVQDGTVVGLGESPDRGRWLALRDAYGNTYTYSHLGELAATYPVGPGAPALTAPEVAGRKLRLFAHPWRPRALRAGGDVQIAAFPRVFTAYERRLLRRVDLRISSVRPLLPGARVIAGTLLGRVGAAGGMRFSIRSAGPGAPAIEAKPILDGWKLLEATQVYRTAGRNPFYGLEADRAGAGRVILLSKEALVQRVLADPRISIYPCGRQDIRAGVVDRRVLALLAYLTESGLHPSVTSLRCGHSYLTASGNVSEHSIGTAVDIAAINGIPVLGNQGPGSITDLAIRRLLRLQGVMVPHQVISLMTYPGAANTLALPDHADHIHVGFRPGPARPPWAYRPLTSLTTAQWTRFMHRIGDITNPVVPRRPSRYATGRGRRG